MCKIENCEKKVLGRGLCSMHYSREKRAEDEFVNGLGPEGENTYGATPDPNVDYDDFWRFIKKELDIQ